jgi:hypothetical protein
MNFFFGIKNKSINCKLTIPKFDNYLVNQNKNIKLYSAFPKNLKWVIKELHTRSDDNFFFLENNLIDNNSIYFLATQDEINIMNIGTSILKNINSFSDTKPSAFRANLRIYITNGGFSSYQSEYPFSMVMKNGSILSPISTLLNQDADKNLIFFKNIFYLPTFKNFKAYLIDIKKNIILKDFNLKTNFSNEIEIEDKFLYGDVFFYSPKFLGIPLYVSVKNNHLSFEHTHPPHHYILSDNKFEIISNLKDRIKKIIKNV